MDSKCQSLPQPMFMSRSTLGNLSLLDQVETHTEWGLFHGVQPKRPSSSCFSNGTGQPGHIAKAKDSSGLMWLVHANSPPGSLVYQLQHGDVIIHQDSPAAKATWRPPQAQASIKEINAHQVDEVFINDPWAEPARQLSRTGDSVLTNLDQTIEQKISQQLDARSGDKDDPMVPSVEPRIAALEQQMAQLQQRSVQLDGKVDYLHQQVESQAAKFEHALDTKLADQMHRIEMLMTKRARSHE